MLLKHQPRTGEHCPSPILRGWRQLHEAFLAHEMRGLVPPCSMITERQGPGGLTSRPVTLSRLNIITGPSNSGKSTLVNLLARAGRDPLTRRPWLGQLSADIHWFDPQPHLLRLEDRDGRVELVHDSQRAPALFARYRAVTLRAPGRRDARPGGRPAGMNQLGRANVS